MHPPIHGTRGKKIRGEFGNFLEVNGPFGRPKRVDEPVVQHHTRLVLVNSQRRRASTHQKQPRCLKGCAYEHSRPGRKESPVHLPGFRAQQFSGGGNAGTQFPGVRSRRGSCDSDRLDLNISKRCYSVLQKWRAPSACSEIVIFPSESAATHPRKIQDPSIAGPVEKI